MWLKSPLHPAYRMFLPISFTQGHFLHNTWHMVIFMLFLYPKHHATLIALTTAH